MFSQEQREGHDKRHKCSACGKVRYEKFMIQKKDIDGCVHVSKTRYGNEMWSCRYHKSCRERVTGMDIY